MKKVLSLLLAIVLMVTTGTAAFAANGTNKVYTGKIEMNRGYVDYTYTDDYFKGSSYDYNNDLAVASAYLQYLPDYEDQAYADRMNNVTDFFKGIGFKNIQSNEDWVTKPNRETFGVACASKAIKVNGQKYTLIAMAFRGCSYENEWASDMNVGASGDHQGFKNASTIAYNFLKDYIKKNHITGKVKIWGAGHSRGGITANMVAGAIDRDIYNGKGLGNGVICSLDDVYFYPYEVPQGVEQSKLNVSYKGIYNNIFNIINRGDIVTYVVPKQMGFGRYGIDCYLPMAGDEGAAAYATQAKNYAMEKMDFSLTDALIPTIFGGKFWVVTVTPNGTVNNIITRAQGNSYNQYQFIEDFMPKLTKYVGGRAGFVKDVQPTLYELLGSLFYIFGGDSFSDFLTLFAAEVTENANAIFFDAYNGNNGFLGYRLEVAAMNAMKKLGAAEYDADQVNAMIPGIVEFIVGLAQAYPDETATLITNLLNIVSNHFLDFVYGYMKVLPADYMENQLAMRKIIPYTDVKTSDKNFKAICWCYDHGLMMGNKTQFMPNQVLTQAQLATIMHRLTGKAVSGVDATSVRAATQADVANAIEANGGVNNVITPSNKTITRGEMAAVLMDYCTR